MRGRLDARGGADTPLVIVDYAHTPAALSAVLGTLRALCAGELWCVFGAGGDRDRGKRRQMGEVAARLADRIVLTDDNPRSESPAQIVADIRAGIGGDVEVTVIHDRELAIRTARLRDHPESRLTIAWVRFFLEEGFAPPVGFRKELLDGPQVGQIPGTLVARRELFDLNGSTGGFDDDLATARVTGTPRWDQDILANAAIVGDHVAGAARTGRRLIPTLGDEARNDPVEHTAIEIALGCEEDERVHGFGSQRRVQLDPKIAAGG